MTEKRVILHLGAPKTGTTSLQHAFVRRRDDLMAEGIVYPVLPRSPGEGRSWSGFQEGKDYGDAAAYTASHASMFWGYLKREKTKGTERKAAPEWRRTWPDILDAFRNGDGKVLVLSFEGAFMTHRNVAWDAVKAEFPGMPVTLTFGLRHPEELFHGLYATHVAGSPRWKGAARRMPTLERYLEKGFEGMAGALIDAVGADEVRPFLAYSMWSSKRTILGAFLEHVGIDTEIEQNFHSRPTMSSNDTLFLRRLNRREVEQGDFRRVVKTIFGQLSADRPKRAESFLPEDVQVALNARFARDVAWLTKVHGVPPPATVERSILPEKSSNTKAEDVAIRDGLLPLLTKGTAQRLTKLIRG